MLWFEAVEVVDSDGPEAANRRSSDELMGRAVKAYTEARVPLPPELLEFAFRLG